MKIVFSGSNNNEKSFLAKNISQEFDLPLIDDLPKKTWKLATKVSFDLLENSNEIDYESYVFFYNALLKNAIFSENLNGKKMGGFVSSSSIYDHYSIKLLWQEMRPMEDDYSEAYLERRMAWYDIIFYIPTMSNKIPNIISKRIEESNKRQVDRNIRKNLIDGTRSIMFRGKLYELSGSRNEKLNDAIHIISEKIKVGV